MKLDQLVLKAFAAIFMGLFSLAVNAIMSISRDLNEVRISLSQVAQTLESQSQTIKDHEGRLRSLEGPNR